MSRLKCTNNSCSDARAVYTLASVLAVWLHVGGIVDGSCNGGGSCCAQEVWFGDWAAELILCTMRLRHSKLDPFVAIDEYPVCERDANYYKFRWELMIGLNKIYIVAYIELEKKLHLILKRIVAG